MKKIFLGFRGPYECSSWADLMTRDEARAYLKGHVPSKILELDFSDIRIEINKGVEDEDGRVFCWGDKPSSGDGPDTQHKGTIVYVDHKVVFNDCVFEDEEDGAHDPAECDLCRKVD